MLWNSGLWVCGKEEAKAYLCHMGWEASAQPMRNQPPSEREARAVPLPSGSPAVGAQSDITAELPPSCDKFPAKGGRARV